MARIPDDNNEFNERRVKLIEHICEFLEIEPKNCTALLLNIEPSMRITGFAEMIDEASEDPDQPRVHRNAPRISLRLCR